MRGKARLAFFCACLAAGLCGTGRRAMADAACASAETQMAIDQCAGADFEHTDARLNQLYQQIMQRLQSDPAQAQSLKTAQRAWLAFRDADCAFRSSGVAGGSIYPMVVTLCRTQLTRARIQTFDSWLHCPEGDTTCPVR